MTPAEIKELFGKFGATLDRDDVWQVQSATVIKHKALERLAVAARITFDAPTVLRAERDEAVILVHGHIAGLVADGGGREEWSIGEALVNVNYKVSGRQAGYVYAMAEKRAKDRVILKLAGLHGLYSEDEADEFKEQNSAPMTGRNVTVSSGTNPAQGGTVTPLSEPYSFALKTMKLSRSKAELREWWNTNWTGLKSVLPEAEGALLIGERNTLGFTLPEHFQEAAE